MHNALSIFIILLSLIFGQSQWLCAQSDPEEVVLTTYYPAPYGEYSVLAVGSTAAMPVNDGVVNFGGISQPQDADAREGDLYYDSGSHTLNYRNNSGWVPILGGAASARAKGSIMRVYRVSFTNGATDWITPTLPSGATNIHSVTVLWR